MTYYDKVFYCKSVGYAAVAPRGGSASVGQIVRQAVTPAVKDERCFVCIIAGTGGGAAPTWVLTKGAKTVDGGITWQECTGASAVNGDLISTSNWDTVKGKAVLIGQIIKQNDEANYHICSTAGTAGTGAEPAFGAAGSTVTDGTVVWTSLGAVGNFTKGGAPHARIFNAGADPWFVTNGIIYVGNNHAETVSTGDLEFVTSYPAQNVNDIGKMLCHDHAGSYPPTELTTGAAVINTGPGAVSWLAGGAFYVYGITFKAGVGGNSADAIIKIGPQGGGNLHNWTYFERCTFWLASTADFTYIYIGQFIYETVIFDNTTVYFNGVLGQLFARQTKFTWCNTLQPFVSGSKIPSFLIRCGGASDAHLDVLFEACDFSQFGGKVNDNSSWWQGRIIMRNCKINPAMTVDTGVLGYPGNAVELQSCSSGIETSRSERYVLEGSDVSDFTVTRNGGAIDPGGLPQSRKLTTFPAALWLRPLQSNPLALWVIGTGSPVSVIVYCGVVSFGVLPMNDEIWLEVEYLSDPDSTLGTIVNTTKPTVLSTGIVVPADDSVWDETPVGFTPFKLTAAILPAHPGYVHVRVMVGKPSVTFYVDPLVVLG